mmetsp:Transcript_15473/g.13510  ORF Transcript_15473/g.13510 Transcript_15473/m.13510 type:complete len:186 (-) Transcript_15473:158-715(-)
MTFNNEKSNFQSNFHSSLDKSQSKYSRSNSKSQSYMKQTESSLNRSRSRPKKQKKIVKSKVLKTLSSSDSDLSLQGTSQFKVGSSSQRKKVPLSIEISSQNSESDKENQETFRNYKAILQERSLQNLRLKEKSFDRRKRSISKDNSRSISRSMTRKYKNRHKNKSKKRNSKVSDLSEVILLKAEV